MIKDELKQMRQSFDMTQAEFGEWLAGQVNVAQDAKLKPVSAYSRQRIHQWESGELPVPMKIENIIMRRQLEQKDKLIQSLRRKRKQKPKP